ncbi:hypothetical protein [Achromobacter animicus]|uniref:hypothetical protein n=1 Tax=Achromobacter animicus TaxID=1389935 RepID=UPI0028B2307F|nr:hypothetical protein [Achromobacter animicus]
MRAIQAADGAVQAQVFGTKGGRHLLIQRENALRGEGRRRRRTAPRAARSIGAYLRTCLLTLLLAFLVLFVLTVALSLALLILPLVLLLLLTILLIAIVLVLLVLLVLLLVLLVLLLSHGVLQIGRQSRRRAQPCRKWRA